MEKLFDDKERNGQRYSKNLENTYRFYDQTAMPEFVKVREMLNDWFARYPNNGKHSLKRDFQSQFEAAFFELFIHELFFQQGFVLSPHPTVPNSSNKPDFLAKKGDLEIYLEAKVATDKPKKVQKQENRRGAIYDTLLDVKSTDFGILFKEIFFKTTKQAKLSRLKSHVQDWLNESHLKQQAIYNDFDENGDECFTYEDMDIKVKLTLLPSKVEENQPISAFLGGSYMGGCEEALRGAIEEKSSKYGILDKPYILCINLIGIRYPYPHEIYNTLFGFRRSQDESHPTDSASHSPVMDGILMNSTGSVFRQVSAFFVTRIFESNVDVADHWLIEHPQPNLKLDFDALELTFNKLSPSGIKTVDKKSIGQILFRQSHLHS